MGYSSEDRDLLEEIFETTVTIYKKDLKFYGVLISDTDGKFQETDPPYEDDAIEIQSDTITQAVISKDNVIIYFQKDSKMMQVAARGYFL